MKEALVKFVRWWLGRPIQEETEPDEPDTYGPYISERNRLIEAKQEAARSYDRAILTLSSGAIALSITFLQFITPTKLSLWFLYASWFGFAVAIGFIVVSFLASQRATEVEIEHLDEWYEQGTTLADQPANPYTRRIRYLNRTAAAAFLAGVILFGLFAGFNAHGRSDHGKEQQGDRRQETEHSESGVR